MPFNFKLISSLEKPASRLVCLGCALGFILLIFGDVVFLHTSLAPLDYDQGILASSRKLPEPRSIFPELPGRSIMDGQGDLWSGSAQFEPAQKFLAFCLRNGESPYWDPYIAAGNLGPEILVDLKFSPVTVMTALLGGSSGALTFVLLGIFLLSAYSIFRTFTTYLGLSLEAALIACAIFFLNGFALANFNLNIGQPYFLAPVVLYAMLAFVVRQTPAHAVLAVAANAMLLGTTFTPTAVMSLLVIYTISFGFGLARSGFSKLRVIAIHLVIPFVSLLLLAFLYVPVFDAYGTYLHTIADYNARKTPGISLVNLISLFSPKHFWQSYVAMQPPATAPTGLFNKYTFHLGLIGPIIGIHALSRLKRGTGFIVIPAAVLFSAAVGQIFNIFPFTLIDRLPFFSFVQNDYWPCMAALSLMVLAAFGYDAINKTNAFTYPCALLVGLISVSFAFLYGYLGLHGHFATATDLRTKCYVAIFVAILLLACALLVLTRRPRFTRWTKYLLLAGLLVEGVYYMNGLRPNRSYRDENLPESVLWVKAEVDRHPGSRILNIGRLGVFANWGSALQIPQLELLSQFWLPWYEEFFHRYIGTDLFLSLGASPDTTVYAFNDASLSLAGVRYVVVDRWNARALALLTGMGYRNVHQDDLRFIFENPHALSRSFAVRDVRTLNGLVSDAGANVGRAAATTDQTLLSELQRVGVHAAKPEESPSSTQDVPGTAQVTAYHHDRVRVHCDLKEAALVVLTDSWSPRWSATIDNKPAYVGKVNVAFRGVAVPAGRHELEFSYYPSSRLVGQVISGATLLGMVIGFWFWTKRSTSAQEPSVSSPESAAESGELVRAVSKGAAKRRRPISRR